MVGSVTTPGWDCFARLTLLTPALSPSSLCYPTQPDDVDESGAFQGGPSFCHFRPLRSFGVHFHAPHASGSGMRYRLLVSAYAFGPTSSRKKLGVKKMGMCVVTVWVQLGVILSLFVSWAKSCDPNVDETLEVACWARCAYFWLLGCLDYLCPWTCPVNPEAANDESRAQATLADPGLELIAPAVWAAASPMAEMSFLLELDACPQCLTVKGLIGRLLVADWT